MDTDDTEKKPCNCCGESILHNASVCFHCGRNQNKAYRILAPTPQWIAIILSSILLILAWGQLIEATKQRKSAEAAFVKADDASKKSEAASNKAEAAEHSVTNIVKASIPLFESLLGKYAWSDRGLSSAEIAKLTKPLKDALIDNSVGIGSGVRP